MDELVLGWTFELVLQAWPCTAVQVLVHACTSLCSSRSRAVRTSVHGNYHMYMFDAPGVWRTLPSLCLDATSKDRPTNDPTNNPNDQEPSYERRTTDGRRRVRTPDDHGEPPILVRGKTASIPRFHTQSEQRDHPDSVSRFPRFLFFGPLLTWPSGLFIELRDSAGAVGAGGRHGDAPGF